MKFLISGYTVTAASTAAPVTALSKTTIMPFLAASTTKPKRAAISAEPTSARLPTGSLAKSPTPDKESWKLLP